MPDRGWPNKFPEAAMPPTDRDLSELSPAIACSGIVLLRRPVGHSHDRRAFAA